MDSLTASDRSIEYIYAATKLQLSFLRTHRWWANRRMRDAPPALVNAAKNVQCSCRLIATKASGGRGASSSSYAVEEGRARKARETR